jgi:hypothetical protein
MAIPRVNVLDYNALGKKFIEWSLDADARPKDLAELEVQLTGIVAFPLPDYIKSLLIIQGGKDVLLLRLPPAELIQDTLDETSTGGGAYPLPGFYREKFEGSPVDNKTFFEFRVGDYTIAHCT